MLSALRLLFVNDWKDYCFGARSSVNLVNKRPLLLYKFSNIKIKFHNPEFWNLHNQYSLRHSHEKHGGQAFSAYPTMAHPEHREKVNATKTT
jgi:hypothetical protein